jgi:hypothetical protein
MGYIYIFGHIKGYVNNLENQMPQNNSPSGMVKIAPLSGHIGFSTGNRQ